MSVILTGVVWRWKKKRREKAVEKFIKNEKDKKYEKREIKSNLHLCNWACGGLNKKPESISCVQIQFASNYLNALNRVSNPLVHKNAHTRQQNYTIMKRFKWNWRRKKTAQKNENPYLVKQSTFLWSKLQSETTGAHTNTDTRRGKRVSRCRWQRISFR